jgi:hypothetical protein
VVEPDLVKHGGGAGAAGSHSSISVKVIPEETENESALDAIDTQLENPLFGTRGGASQHEIARLLHLNDTVNFHQEHKMEHVVRTPSTCPARTAS